MKRPDKYEKIVDPYSKDIAETARSLIEQGEPFTIMVDVTEEAREKGLKNSIAERLKEYGIIVRNSDYSTIISIQPHTLEHAKKLEEDYYNDKLPNVRALEISTKSVVYCGRTLDDYLPYK